MSALDDWITREAVSFSLDSPETLNTAVDRMVAALGDSVEVFGFGEALHGGEEILLLRNRLFVRLAVKHGFGAIAVESSFPRGRIIDDYVVGRGAGASYEDVAEKGFSHGFGKLAANCELVEWLHDYNVGSAHPVPLRFYGFDSPTEMMSSDSPRQLLYVALDYLTSLDQSAGEERRKRIDELLGEDSLWENPAVAFEPAKGIGLSAAATALRIEAENLITELKLRRPELTAASDAGRYADAAHYAELARQFLGYHAALARQASNGERLVELLGIRDLMMADTLAYVAARERGRGKVLVFAHNSHLKCGRAQWQLGPDMLAWWPAGAHVREMLGPRYAVIGTAVGTSEANGIGTPESGTLEARLIATPGPIRFLPTDRGQGLPKKEIDALPTRTGSTKNGSYFPLTPQAFTEYDGLIALDSVTYNRGGPPLPK